MTVAGAKYMASIDCLLKLEQHPQYHLKAN